MPPGPYEPPENNPMNPDGGASAPPPPGGWQAPPPGYPQMPPPPQQGAYPPASGAPGAYPPPGQAYPPAAGYPPAGYPQGYQPAPSTESKATIGLILAIASWLICPIVLSIVALIMASQSNSAIDASGGRYTGRGMNTATKWISWINIVVYIIGGIAFAIFFFWIAQQDPTVYLPDPTYTGF